MATEELENLTNDFCNKDKLLLAGIKSLEDKAYKQAIEAFTDSIVKDLYRIEPYLGRAISWLHLEEYTNALSDCTFVINVKRDLSIAYHIRALAWEGLTQQNRANEDRARMEALNKIQDKSISYTAFIDIWRAIMYF
jgi:hypothetical protein